ncbi:unnamed protein product [Chilo suppressalis]|uniref:TMEM205-like domain-containing protein n=1 Tax=Chilo suppressalis TaxID=168631 RepID=A0ABN8BEX1_CHISP|nr:unnamed protein product [Chilo suppressalis]
MCKVCNTQSSVMEALPPAPVPKSTKSLERLKKKHNIITDPHNEEKQKEVEYQPDLLAVSTQYTKLAYDLFKSTMVRLQETKAYVIELKSFMYWCNIDKTATAIGAGIVLYFSLPRHEFGRVQTALFPVYYAFNASVSLLAIVAYFKTQCITHFAATSWVQVGRLVLGELAHCPRYVRVLRTFRMYHSSIAMGTMICLGCSLYSTLILVDSMCQ